MSNFSTHRGLFMDEVEIIVLAGAGGNGCMSFRRERFIPHGGPNGGDGGNGGSVFLEADDSINTLQHLAGHHHWKAARGGHGMGKDMHGRNGRDTIVPVPAGTIVRDADHEVMLKDLAAAGERVCVARGGRGGRGNARFKSSTNQAPREHEPGEPGQKRRLRLELKLIADAGLVGKPNAGKSTLLSRLSKARPRVAAYPFTTLSPSLGIVEMGNYRRFVMADIPGLIEGAHEGAGLGIEFLRHIERTRLLVHVLDVCPTDGDPAEDYRVIRNELEEYSPLLAEKPEIIVANKMDLTASEENHRRLEQELRKPVLPISGVTGRGLEGLTEQIWRLLREAEAQDPERRAPGSS